MAAIELRAVTKTYANVVSAVRNVDLTIGDGEFMVFLGPSGCGKSTTLRMIAGLEDITSGDLFVDGIRMNDVDPSKRDLAIVFQNYALYPHMSVRENLAFGLKLRHLERTEIARRIDDISAVLGIGPMLDRRPAQLSGGQRQRVALGRALVREPKAFLLDEPLSNLDAKLRATMRTELIKLHRRLGATMIHVTHDQVEAMTMGERICIMRDGEVVQVGRPLDVYRNPADTFVAGFLATPPMNLLSGRLEAQGDQLFAVTEGFRCALPPAYRQAYASHAGRQVIIGLRPEDFHETPDRAGALGGLPVTLTVTTVEALGPETVLMASLKGDAGPEIAVRVDFDREYEVGARVTLHYDTAQIHIFDVETTKALARPVIPAG
ncbi:MAG TPA: sn-glycerol-3-phosphate ABC transporter ATP-binding protein UgpC [Ancylobacter sp.]